LIRKTTTSLKGEEIMKKSFFSCALSVILLLAVALIATPATAAGKEMGMKAKAAEMKAAKTVGKMFVMSGKIKGVYPQWGTAVIDCPEGNQIFTVAGPFASNAELLKGGKPAQLEEFKEGESVTVKWKTVPNGHLILMLSAK
jgi:hypothetical protein